MDAPELTAFIAVARSGSFSQAAEDLHLTQPAVSKRIAALEASLATRLFDRIGRRIVLTEAGEALLPRARRILDEMDDARRALSQRAGQVAGTLTVATSHHVGLHRLPPVLRAFTRHYPAVELDLRLMDSEGACQAVADGDLELAVVTLPLAAPQRLHCTPVWEDRLQPVAGPDHPLSRLEPLEPAALSEYPAILPATGTYTRQVIDDGLLPLGVAIQEGLCTNFLETIKMLVSVGLGWSVLPETVIDDDVRRLDMGLEIKRELGVVQHRDKTLSKAARALIAILGEIGRETAAGRG